MWIKKRGDRGFFALPCPGQVSKGKFCMTTISLLYNYLYNNPLAMPGAGHNLNISLTNGSKLRENGYR
jgi:hypothetical protein